MHFKKKVILVDAINIKKKATRDGKKLKEKFSMARSLPVENLLPQNWSIRFSKHVW